MKNNQPLIETERCCLHRFSNKDLERVFQGLSHPDVIRYYGIQFDDLESTREQMEWFRQLEEKGTGQWMAIWSKDGSTFYGAGGLNDLDKQKGKAEIGFWLLPEHWGKGLMQEVLPTICTYGFKHFGLHKIEGFVDTENHRCKQALTKLNFQYDSCLPDYEEKNGRSISLDIYSLPNPTHP